MKFAQEVRETEFSGGQGEGAELVPVHYFIFLLIKLEMHCYCY